MKNVAFLLVITLFIAQTAFSQTKDTVRINKLEVLPEVILQSFNYNKTWQEIPASVAYLDSKKLQEITTTSLLPSLNTIPGIRMEQRSPESFRLSMRGSVLRSPFGVRDLKVYWNGLPLSDGGGNTYLNLLNSSQLSSIEVIKGNTASMYGAGIGGVLLLNTNYSSSYPNKNIYQASIDGGSYGLLEETANWQHQNGNFSSKLMQSHEQCDGYRQQSASHKDNVTYTATYNTQKNKLDLITFYTSQYYQTPGGLTLAQMQQNPTLARTKSGTSPSAVQQHTSITNNTVFIGLHDVYKINHSFSSDIATVYNHTSFTNPFITDYETRSETNMNLNGKLIYKHSIGKAELQWITGGEILCNHAIIEDDGNLNGVRDSVQYKDNTFTNQWFVFTQGQLTAGSWTMQLGISGNREDFRYKRLSDGSLGYTHKNTDIVTMPRATIGYNLNNKATVFAVVSEGFSAPSLLEIRPSNRAFNTTLQPEYGWGEELGIKGGLLNHRLVFDIDLYRLRLHNAIVSRLNSNGNNYYINAGDTKQDGVEVYLKYKLFQQNLDFISAINITNSYSYQPYKFITYQQGGNNYSGNHLTGVPHNVNVSGLDIASNKGYCMHVSYTYTSSIPLTDANDAYANAYHLLQTKCGWQGHSKKIQLEIYAGGDNLLNEHYSLGNDINAAGKRFYNPAATINFFAGCKIGW